jgi:ABC-type transport system involved in multi-copper enzyme maturation permease subunit
LFHYHKPHQVLYGAVNWPVNIAVLLIVAALTFAAATVAFERRDLTR